MSYQNKEQATINLTRDTFRMTGFWRKNQEEQQEVISAFLNGLKEIWEIQFEVELNFSNEVMASLTGGASYIHEPPKLIVYKPSVMTLLHMFKYVLRYLVPDYPTVDGEANMDSAIWSHTIFKLAMPVLYEKNIQNGTFMIQTEAWFPLEGMEFPETEGATTMGSQKSVAVTTGTANSSAIPSEAEGLTIEEILQEMRRRRGLTDQQ